MKILPFKSSAAASLGVELELQIIDPITFDMISKAKDLMRNIQDSPFQKFIKPEITQSMIEINSSIHQSSQNMYEELLQLHSLLLEQGKILGVNFSGGGTHPFQKWALRKIFPTQRFRNKAKLYQYLSKRSTVFGQHVHVGCPSGEEALYLTHALARYVPHLIALSASSPFYEGVDTGYQSARSTVFSAFPLSGVIPNLNTWEEFSAYFYKMRKLKVIDTMKDFYWDIRPKPEFGTVEIRVCDTPLTIKKAIVLAAYIQSIAQYLLKERPPVLCQDLYFLYNYNRFQASRFGFEGDFIHPKTLQHGLISDDIRHTIKTIEKHANDLGNMGYMSQLMEYLITQKNDATLLRKIFQQVGSMPKLMREQCIIWEKNDEKG